MLNCVVVVVFVGVPYPIFLGAKSFSLYPKFCCPRPCGSALKVPGGGGGWVGGVGWGGKHQ